MRQVREVQVEDVLGREPVTVEIEAGRRLPARPHRARDRRRRLDRLRAVPPDRARAAAAARAARPRRGQPLRDRAGADPRPSLHRLRVDPRRLQGGGPDGGRDAALPPRRRVPRGRLQARLADRGEPARGGAQQRDRHARVRDRGGGCRHRSGSCSCRPTRRSIRRTRSGRRRRWRSGSWRRSAGGIPVPCSAPCGSGTCSGRAAASCRSSAGRSSRAAR